MNFSSWLESVELLIGYHQTDMNENVSSIFANGFSIQKARKYELGLGVYLRQSLWGMKYNENKPIIQCRINNANKFLDLRVKSNAIENFSPEEQQFLYGLNQYVPPNTYNSPIIKKVQQFFSGLIVNHSGGMIVAYNAADVIPQAVVSEDQIPS